MTLIKTQPKLFIGDVGTEFRVEVTEKVWSTDYGSWVDQAVDISDATTIEVVFLTPAGVARPRVASFVTDGADGLIRYICAAGDLDQVGNHSRPWRFGGYIERPGKKHQTTLTPFVVELGVPRPPIKLEPLPASVTLGAPAATITVA